MGSVAGCSADTERSPPDAALQALLDEVKRRRAIDFSAYRPSTIRRRVALRLSATGMADYAAYRRYLAETPDELNALMDVLTIKVSHFFRNPLVFEVLRERVLPELLESLGGRTLRVWCAGCARGEEAYSLAILLREIQRKERLPGAVFILATDIDQQVLASARSGVYAAEALPEVKKGYLDRYFTPVSGGYRLAEEIRSMVTFAAHDLTAGRPPKEGLFSDYQLILCRNVLIYFEPGLQGRLLAGLKGFVAAGGYLVLGEAEALDFPPAGPFQETLPRTRIFRKESQ